MQTHICASVLSHPSGAIVKETEMGEYSFLHPNEDALVRDEDENEDMGLKRWDLPRRKSRGADGADKPILLDFRGEKTNQ